MLTNIDMGEGDRGICLLKQIFVKFLRISLTKLAKFFNTFLQISLFSPMVLLKFVVLLSGAPGILHSFLLKFTTNSRYNFSAGYNFRLLIIFTFGGEREGVGQVFT